MFLERVKAILISKPLKTVVSCCYLLVPVVATIREVSVFVCGGSGFACPYRPWLENSLYIFASNPINRWILFGAILIEIPFLRERRLFFYMLLFCLYLIVLSNSMILHRDYPFDLLFNGRWLKVQFFEKIQSSLFWRPLIQCLKLSILLFSGYHKSKRVHFLKNSLSMFLLSPILLLQLESVDQLF